MRLTASDFDQRIDRTRQRMRDAGIDALFIFSDEYRAGHAMYYTGFRTINMIEESSHAIWLPLEGAPVAFTGPLNTFAARRDSHIGDVRPIPGLEHEMRELLAQAPKRPQRVGIVGANLLPLATWRMLEPALDGIEILDSTDLVISERSIKSDVEMALLERAGEIGDAALRTALAALAPGQTENDMCAIGEHATRAMGGDIGCAYLAVIGENTDLPTWRPTARAIRNDELLMLDFGPSFEGYASDVAITVAMPGASDEQRQAIDFAWKASAQAMACMRPGVKASEVFERVLEMVDKAGYKEYFLPYTTGTRAIGHGVGLDVVEPPDFGPNSTYLLQPGMVLAFKFDLHGFAWGGLRVEHVVAIKADGPHPLNCPLSDACPARRECNFYKPGGGVVDIPWPRIDAAVPGDRELASPAG